MTDFTPTLTINPLWISYAAMAVRLVLAGTGLMTASEATDQAPKIVGAVVLIGSLAWMVWAKFASHQEKKALAAASPSTVVVK